MIHWLFRHANPTELSAKWSISSFLFAIEKVTKMQMIKMQSEIKMDWKKYDWMVGEWQFVKDRIGSRGEQRVQI